MKVAVVTQYFPTSTNPWAGHSAYQTLRILASRYDLHVFYPEVSYPRLLKPAGHAVSLNRNWNPPDVRVTYIPYPALPLVSRPLNGSIMASRLLPHVRRFQPDVLLNYVVYPDGLAAVRIGRKLGVPVVLTAIGSDLNRMSDPLCAKLTRSTLRHADFVTTVSRDLARTATTLGAKLDNVTAILNGCDTTIFHPRDHALARQSLDLDAAAEIIVYVGRLDVRKGLLELIEAIVALRTGRPVLRCYIVGDGPDKPILLEAIARNAAEYITLIPPCDTNKVALWMAASNLVALPSYREGCPNVIIEGLAAGRPIVATNVGGIPELMDDACGRMVPPRDIPALAHALEEVLNQSWSPEAISSKHSRSWRDVADDLSKVLNNALRRR